MADELADFSKYTRDGKGLAGLTGNWVPDTWVAKRVTVQVSQTYDCLNFAETLPNAVCVHCALLPNGQSDSHGVLGVCTRGKPHEAWFNRDVLEQLLDQQLTELGYDITSAWLRDWSVDYDSRGSTILRLRTGHGKTYAWRLQNEQRHGFVLGVWAD